MLNVWVIDRSISNNLAQMAGWPSLHSHTGSLAQSLTGASIINLSVFWFEGLLFRKHDFSFGVGGCDYPSNVSIPSSFVVTHNLPKPLLLVCNEDC